MQGSMPVGRKLAVLAGVLGALLVPQVAQAAPPASVFNDSSSPVTCEVQTNGVDFCSNFNPDLRSTVPAFDNVPIDVNVALPAEATFGSGPYPLMMMFHGYGGYKLGLGAMQPLARPRLRHLLDDRPRLPRVVRLAPHVAARPTRAAAPTATSA